MSSTLSAGSRMCSKVTTAVRYNRRLLDIEKNFDHCWAFTVLSANWTLCYYLIGAYLVAIYAGRKYMTSRPAFQLRMALLFWNISLASYSALSSWRLLPAIVHAVRYNGFHSSICELGPQWHGSAIALWLLLFIFSKIVEFGDTAFIVLRKTPLTFLHWYHHVTVAFFAWSSGAYASPMQIYFATLNLVVHALMYSYYALKVLGIRIPKGVSFTITSLQLVQMAVGILITGYVYRVKLADPTCMVTDQEITIAAGIYCTYFVLFLNFFLKAYVLRKKPMGISNGDAKKLD